MNMFQKVVIVILASFYLVSCTDNSNYKDVGIWVKLEEGKSIDGYILNNNHIYGGEFDYVKDLKGIPPLEGVDIKTFEVCKGSGYARDKNHVYYPIRILACDGEGYGYLCYVEYIVKTNYFYGLVSIYANPHSFKYIGNGYAVDGSTMYYRGRKLDKVSKARRAM